MLQTRAIARADVIAALQPERIQLDRFIDAWYGAGYAGGAAGAGRKLGKSTVVEALPGHVLAVS